MCHRMTSILQLPLFLNDPTFFPTLATWESVHYIHAPYILAIIPSFILLRAHIITPPHWRVYRRFSTPTCLLQLCEELMRYRKENWMKQSWDPHFICQHYHHHSISIASSPSSSACDSSSSPRLFRREHYIESACCHTISPSTAHLSTLSLYKSTSCLNLIHLIHPKKALAVLYLDDDLSLHYCLDARLRLIGPLPLRDHTILAHCILLSFSYKTIRHTTLLTLTDIAPLSMHYSHLYTY